MKEKCLCENEMCIEHDYHTVRTYDAHGNITSETTEHVNVKKGEEKKKRETRQIEYDDHGNVTKETIRHDCGKKVSEIEFGKIIKCEYDNNGNCIHRDLQVANDGKVTYEESEDTVYDKNGNSLETFFKSKCFSAN